MHPNPWRPSRYNHLVHSQPSARHQCNKGSWQGCCCSQAHLRSPEDCRPCCSPRDVHIPHNLTTSLNVAITPSQVPRMQNRAMQSLMSSGLYTTGPKHTTPCPCQCPSHAGQATQAQCSCLAVFSCPYNTYTHSHLQNTTMVAPSMDFANHSSDKAVIHLDEGTAARHCKHGCLQGPNAQHCWVHAQNPRSSLGAAGLAAGAARRHNLRATEQRVTEVAAAFVEQQHRLWVPDIMTENLHAQTCKLSNIGSQKLQQHKLADSRDRWQESQASMLNSNPQPRMYHIKYTY